MAIQQILELIILRLNELEIVALSEDDERLKPFNDLIQRVSDFLSSVLGREPSEEELTESIIKAIPEDRVSQFTTLGDLLTEESPQIRYTIEPYYEGEENEVSRGTNLNADFISKYVLNDLLISQVDPWGGADYDVEINSNEIPFSIINDHGEVGIMTMQSLSPLCIVTTGQVLVCSLDLSEDYDSITPSNILIKDIPNELDWTQLGKGKAGFYWNPKEEEIILRYGSEYITL